MKFGIVYWSRYGNNKKIVTLLSEKLQKKGAEIQVFKTDEVNPTALPKADVYVFSAATEAFNIQKNMKNLMKKLEEMEKKKYGIINTHAMKKDRLHRMEALLSKKKMEKIAEVEFQMGKEVNTGNGLMNGWETKLSEFTEQL